MDLMARIEMMRRAAGIPGIAVAVLQRGQQVLSAGFGTTSVEQGQPVTPETLFRIGSVTKPLVSTTIMRLSEANKVELDRPVVHYVPWLKLHHPSAAEQITLRMLLTHSSGLPTRAVSFHGPRDPVGLERYVRDELPQLSLATSPGTAYAYSNPGYVLAGYIAAVAGDTPFESLMQDLLFDPLGMKRTTFDPLIAATFPLSLAHLPKPDGDLQVRRPIGEHTGFRPAGGCFSTVQDLASFARCHIQAEPGLLNHTSLQGLHSVQVATYGPTPGGRTLAFGETRRNGRVRLIHGGQVDGYCSLLVIYPQDRSAIIILTNWLAADQNLEPFRLALEQEILGYPDDSGWLPPRVPPERSRWQEYQGSYLNGQGGLLVIRTEPEGLTATWNGSRMLLEALAPDHYIAGSKYGVGFPADHSLVLFRNAIYHRIRPVPGAVALQTSYAGEYGLRHRLWIRILDGELRVYSGWYRREVPCVPVEAGTFACEWGWFTFVTDETGHSHSIRWAGESLIPKLSDSVRPYLEPARQP